MKWNTPKLTTAAEDPHETHHHNARCYSVAAVHGDPAPVGPGLPRLGACEPTHRTASSRTTSSSVVAEPAPVVACPGAVDAAKAERLLREANELIRKADEHPSNAELDQILPRLEAAACAGDLLAQERFGMYVVGYYYTDEMFWPSRPQLAARALAMLLTAAQREPESTDPLLRALRSNPADFTSEEGPPPLPQPWLDAAHALLQSSPCCPSKPASVASGGAEAAD
jgi:hypothetical protein